MSPENDPETGDFVERQVLAEHRRLDALFLDVREAFQAPDAADSSREVFHSVATALETHFDQEERLYYPAIWALRPKLRRKLQAFLKEHEAFRSELERVDELLSDGDVAAAGRAVDALAESFRRHEVAEEATLRRMESEFSDAT